MSTAYQYKICKTCLNRKFDRNKGILCGLTDEKPNFTGKCPDFSKDPKVKDFEKTLPKSNQRKSASKKIGILGATLTIAGIIFMQLGNIDRHPDSTAMQGARVGFITMILGFLLLIIALIMKGIKNITSDQKPTQFRDPNP